MARKILTLLLLWAFVATFEGRKIRRRAELRCTGGATLRRFEDVTWCQR